MTSALIVIEIDDLADAAHGMHGDVAIPLQRSVSRLAGVVGTAGSMAGSDPGGVSWAAAYDATATVALAAAADLTDAAHQIAAMFGQSARNWAAAESASTPGQARHVVAELASLPMPTRVDRPGRVPSARGGSAPAPAGWELVAAAVHLVWPDGHQDLLRRSAAGWAASADTLQACSDCAAFASVRSTLDRLPEAEDMYAVGKGLCLHLRDVASVHRALGRACEQLAAHIDTVRHEIAGELASLAEWSAGIEAVGLLFGVASGGTSVLGAQGLEALRVSRAAARISTVIARFIDSARAACEGIPTAAAVVESISASLTPLLGTRLAIAGVTSVGTLPRTARTIETAEMAADRRLVSGAAGGDGMGEGASTWANPVTLQDHFARHGHQLGCVSSEDYARQANAFLHRALRLGLPTKIDETGTLRIYDRATGTFGSYTSSGQTRTFFKPASHDYWERQHGALQ